MNHTTIKKLLKEAQRLAPDSVWWIPNSVICSNLGISDATRKNYLQVLGQLNWLQSQDKKRSGLTRYDYLVLVIFRKLAELFGSEKRANPSLAIDHFPLVIKELKKNEHI